jgi:hypothetical protein
MLSSLLAQTNDNWCAHVIQDGTDNEISYKIVKSLGDNRIRYHATEERYNDWGHTPRELGKQESEARYIILSGDDNYYMPVFVEELSIASLDNPGIIYWDMVHSHYKYSYFKCSLGYNQIDMGAFATRNDLAKQIKLNTSYAADGEFIRDFNKKFPNEKRVKIDKVLFVHN